MALAANALTTVAQLEAALGLSAGAATARCEFSINAASDAIEGYCSRGFARVVGQVDNLAGFDSTRLYLSRGPIESVASVVFDGTTIDASSYQVFGQEGYVYRDVGWAWTASQASAIAPYAVPGTEKRVIAVTYTGGYALATAGRSPGTYPQPYDLEEACIMLAAYKYRSFSQNVGISQESAGNASRAYGSKAGRLDMPDYVAAILEGYTRIL